MRNTSPEFETAFATFLAGCQARMNAYQTLHGYRLTPLYCDDGIRYIRIWEDTGQHICWGFVDKQTGDLLKPEGWKKPAKHARGNIFDADGGLRFVTPHGPMYLDAIAEMTK